MGQIKVQKNVGGIEGLCIIEPTVHGDNRGYFMETYNSKDMKEAGIDRVFVQDNQSCSTKGVLRGLHFQKEYPQAKLVRAVKGSVFDWCAILKCVSASVGASRILSDKLWPLDADCRIIPCKSALVSKVPEICYLVAELCYI